MNVYEISKIKQHNMGYSKPFFDDLEKLFQNMGTYIDIDAEELNEFFWDYSWSEIAKAFFKPIEEDTWYNYYKYYNSYDFEYEAFLRALMEHFGYTVLEYKETTTFENSGLDIIAMSFIVSDGINIYTSLNNIYERY
jgi:hypothetical protein